MDHAAILAPCPQVGVVLVENDCDKLPCVGLEIDHTRCGPATIALGRTNLDGSYLPGPNGHSISE